MPGWNLREGALVDEKVSDDEYCYLFNYVFSDACKKTNTYKFGLIKSICDQAYDLYDDGQRYYLLYENFPDVWLDNPWIIQPTHPFAKIVLPHRWQIF